MIDTGATGRGYINRPLARKLKLRLTPLAWPLKPTGFNGKQLEGGTITHTVTVTLQHINHKERIRLFVTATGRHELILGQPWLYKHRIVPDYDNRRLLFNAPRCQAHCLSEPEGPARDSREGSANTPIGDQHLNKIRNPKLRLKLTTRTRRHHEVAKMNRQLSATDEHDDGVSHSIEDNTDMDTESELTSAPEMDIYSIGAAPFLRSARRHDHEIFAVTMADIDKALAIKEHTDPATKVPTEYHDLLHVFSRREADKLAPRRPYDHKIILKDGKEHGFGPLYGMSQNELKVLRKYLDDHLAKGFIRASSSPVASPVIFVKKPGGGLRFCVDYRALNALTVKNRYPIPLIQETLTRLSKAKYYTKLDIIAAFNKLRIAKGDEWLTAFRTRYGLFEYLVMPFGLSNAPGTFQHFVNDVLRPYLDIFCTAYIDDILIYSDSLKEHRKHVRLVLEALEEHGIQLDIDKCEFHETEVTYLGYVISTDGIKMDPKKVQAIVDWEYPTNVRDVRAFIGFANFYRRFIDDFSEIVAPMVALTRKDVPFRFDLTCRQAFDRLKNSFASAPILRHFDPDLPIVIEADASDHVTAGIISQQDAEGILKPVAYFSKRMNPAECNYEIYDKELLAIIRCFEQWRPELEGASFPIQVLSDHKNLQYFTTTKQLSHRQARWSEYLSRFDFTITYRPGKQGEKPDALTRRSQDDPGKEQAREARKQTLLRPDLFKDPIGVVMKAPPMPPYNELNLTETNRSIQQIIEEEYPKDKFIAEILELIRTGKRRSKKISLSECEDRAGQLYFRNRLVIPDHDELKLKLLRLAHDSPAGGHSGRGKTLDILQREYYWHGMFETIRRYVSCCHTCRRSKASREKRHGLLKLLPIPELRWRDISVDFVVDLPESEGCTNIMVVVDRLTKYRHLIPCSSIRAPDVANLFYQHVWKLHGLPDTIVSDRGTQFVSAFWTELCQQLRIDPRMSSAFHPETDGQTENANAVMEQVLRAFTNYRQDDWAKWLPAAEFEANNTTSESTRVSPFLATYGQHPRMGFEPPSGTHRPRFQVIQVEAANDFVENMKELQEFIREELLWAQGYQQEYANRIRSPAPDYKVGDRVWLNARNIRTKRESKKLDWKNLGPYTILNAIGSHAYRLDLPENMKVHPIFHVSLLRPAAHESDYLPGQLNPPPEAVEVEGELEWTVDSVEKLRYNRRRRYHEYLVRWTGYEELSWEPATEMKDTEAVLLFHKRYPSIPEPT